MATIRDLAKRGNIYEVDPRTLQIIEGFNSREDYGDIDALKKSIIENGVRQPLRGYVENDQIWITDGHRRLRAVMQAIAEGHEIATVPLLSEDRYASQEDYLLTQIVSNDGKPLTELEEAKVYRKLLNFGWSEDSIAKKTGRSVSTVRNRLMLASAPQQVQQMVAEGSLSPSVVVSEIRESGNSQTTVDNLTEAVAEAKAEGKPKATSKHLDAVKEKAGKEPKKVNIKKVLNELTTARVTQNTDGTVDLSAVPSEVWQQIRKYVGVE